MKRWAIVELYFNHRQVSNCDTTITVCSPRTERATRDLTIRVEIQTPSGAPVDMGRIQIGETPEDKAPRRRRTEIDPEIFMQSWKEKYGLPRSCGLAVTCSGQPHTEFCQRIGHPLQ